MLQITVPGGEFFDEETNEFVVVKEQTLQMEHSLVSLSKWEAKWNKAFLGKSKKTTEEMIDYFRCMTITKNVNPLVYLCLSQENIDLISQYISAPMTATTIREIQHGSSSRETFTSELIYYWMIALNIPFECQKWHLNRLITLIRVCQIKTQPPKKMSRGEVMRQNASLNAARRRKLHSRG